MKPAEIERVFGRGRLKMVTGEHVEVYREAVAAGERRRYTKRFVATSDADYGPWTEREWRILARLIGHGIRCVPDVVQFDGGAGGRTRQVQTYDAGVTVDQWATLLPVAREGATRRHVFEDCAHWWALAHHCLLALDEIHALQLVHLDVKADNICIPYDPATFDATSDERLHVVFDRLALIDFAFSLVSREKLARALPIGWQKDYDYQSPRLLRALEAGREGNLGPTQELDWRCDLYSLAAMLRRYLPNDAWARTIGVQDGWTAERYDAARALVYRLRECHDQDLPTMRPHAALVEVTSAQLRAHDMARSLAEGWSLVPGAVVEDGVTLVTPLTRIALARVPITRPTAIAAPPATALAPALAQPGPLSVVVTPVADTAAPAEHVSAPVEVVPVRTHDVVTSARRSIHLADGPAPIRLAALLGARISPVIGPLASSPAVRRNPRLAVHGASDASPLPPLDIPRLEEVTPPPVDRARRTHGVKLVAVASLAAAAAIATPSFLNEQRSETRPRSEELAAARPSTVAASGAPAAPATSSPATPAAATPAAAETPKVASSTVPAVAGAATPPAAHAPAPASSPSPATAVTSTPAASNATASTPPAANPVGAATSAVPAASAHVGNQKAARSEPPAAVTHAGGARYPIEHVPVAPEKASRTVAGNDARRAHDPVQGNAARSRALASAQHAAPATPPGKAARPGSPARSPVLVAGLSERAASADPVVATERTPVVVAEAAAASATSSPTTSVASNAATSGATSSPAAASTTSGVTSAAVPAPTTRADDVTTQSARASAPQPATRATPSAGETARADRSERHEPWRTALRDVLKLFGPIVQRAAPVEERAAQAPRPPAARPRALETKPLPVPTAPVPESPAMVAVPSAPSSVQPMADPVPQMALANRPRGDFAASTDARSAPRDNVPSMIDARALARNDAGLSDARNLGRDDMVDQARRLLTDAVPRVASQAGADAYPILWTAAMADSGGQERAVMEATYAPWRSERAYAPTPGVDVRARQLHEQARAAYAAGRDTQAYELALRGFGLNPRDPDLAGLLAYLQLKLRPEQAETARQLALHALAFSGARRGARLDDWSTLAIASALAGREVDATRAFMVGLALSDDAERSCRVALQAYAEYGTRLRVPVESLLRRVHAQGRDYGAPACARGAARTLARAP